MSSEVTIFIASIIASAPFVHMLFKSIEVNRNILRDKEASELLSLIAFAMQIASSWLTPVSAKTKAKTLHKFNAFSAPLFSKYSARLFTSLWWISLDSNVSASLTKI